MKFHNPYLSVAIWSENHKKLAEWYRDVLGIPIRRYIPYPNDDCYDMDVGDTFFSIGKHDKVHGKSKDPYRMMVGFQIDSVSKVYTELKDKKITWIAKPFMAPTGEIWCMTLADPEGNIVQFFGQK